TQPTNWKNQTPQERIEYLQTLAIQVADRDVRTNVPNVTHGGTQSSYDHDSRNDSSTIAINANFINHDEPYNAIESMFHESCHAQQKHVIANPNLAESPEQLKNIQDNDVAYIEEKEDPFVYHLQTLEQQARQSARTDMEQMFGDQDNTAYAQHRASRDAHNAEWDADAADYVNKQPQFQEFSGTAQDKVNQYIAQRADRIRQQSQTTPETAQDTSHDQSSSPQLDEDQEQQNSYGRKR
ncbi:MAG: hypothetical protein ACKO83_07830, partial [Roseiflexaceae bacterium]